jgi:hypothetical protein
MLGPVMSDVPLPPENQPKTVVTLLYQLLAFMKSLKSARGFSPS